MTTIVNVYDLEVYIDGLCVGGAESGILCVGQSMTIDDVDLKYSKIYRDKIQMLGAAIVITYKYKRKKYVTNGVLHQSEICINYYNHKFFTAKLEIVF